MKLNLKSFNNSSYIYKDFTLMDIGVILFNLVIVLLFVSSNLTYSYIYAASFVSLTIIMELKIDEERIYHLLFLMLKYVFSKKTYYGNEINNLYFFDKINGDFILNKDGSSSYVLEVEPINNHYLHEQEQIHLINNTYLVLLNKGYHLNIIKTEEDFADNHLSDLVNAADELKERYDEKEISEEEYTFKGNIILDEIELSQNINKAKLKVNKFYVMITLSDEDKTLIEEITDVFNNNHLNLNQLKNNQLKNFINHYYDLKTNDHLKFNFSGFNTSKKKYSYLLVNKFPLELNYYFLDNLFLENNILINLKLIPYDKNEAIKAIDKTIKELESHNNNDTSKNIAELNELTSLSELANNLTLNEEVLYHVNLLIKVEDELNSSSSLKRIRQVLKENNLSCSLLKGRQGEVILCDNASGRLINSSLCLLASSLSKTFPFLRKTKSDDKGHLIGYSNNLPFYFDPFKRDLTHLNSNMIILGKSGSGKTYFASSLVKKLSLEAKIYIFDPEGEYSTLVKSLNGITYDEENKITLNPLIIHDSFNEHLLFLEVFFKTINKGISDEGLELLNKEVISLYQKFNITAESDLTKLNNEDYPLLSDFYEHLVKKAENEEDDYKFHLYSSLLSFMYKFSASGRSSYLYNNKTALKESNVNSFNFNHLLANEDSSSSYSLILVILKYVESKIMISKNEQTVLIIDEAHLFLNDKEHLILDFIYNLAKRIRKYQGSLILISQNISDFINHKEEKTSALFNSASYIFYFNLNSDDLNKLDNLYLTKGGLSSKEKELIASLKRGTAYEEESVFNKNVIHIL